MSTVLPLLPPGVHDLIGETACQQEEKLAIIRALFKQHDITLVLPPLLEYYDALPDIGGESDENTFHSIEVETGKTVAIRTDITPQIARLAITRLKDKARPLMLGYYGTILHQKTAHRQRLQVGVECVGATDTQQFVQLTALALNALRKMDKLVEPVVLLCHPQVLKKYYNAEKLKSADNRQLPPPPATENIKRIAQALDNKSIHNIIDMNESNGFRYQTGECFMILDQRTKTVLARGGIYDIPTPENRGFEPAVGFSFYIQD